ncbi:MAG: GNAT family N-acetyltransferase [Halioglobus sp.]
MDFENIVYVVSSDTEMGQALAALLAGYDIRVKCFPDAEHFMDASETLAIENSCVLLEIDFSAADGIAMIKRLMLERQCPPIVVLGTDTPSEVRQHIVELGATDFIDKPLATTYLLTRISELLPGADGLPHTATSVSTLTDGTEVTFRMTHPQDAEMQQAFVVGLSDRSRYLRFFSGMEKLPSSVLEEFTHPKYPFSYAVIATIPDGAGDRQVGVARYAPMGTKGVAEFAVAISDDLHGQGIATQLMRLLILAASVGGINRLEGLILRENAPMLSLAKKLGFRVSADHGEGPSMSLFVKDLREPADKPDGGP